MTVPAVAKLVIKLQIQSFENKDDNLGPNVHREDNSKQKRYILK
jgi:hypothetical protein